MHPPIESVIFHNNRRKNISKFESWQNPILAHFIAFWPIIKQLCFRRDKMMTA